MATAPLATLEEFHSLALSEEACAGIAAVDIEACILTASSDAYSYLRSRYSLPLVTWGKDLRMAVCKIAALYVLDRRGRNTSDPADLALERAAERAVLWLKDVAANRAAADVVDTSPAATAAPRVVSNKKRGW